MKTPNIRPVYESLAKQAAANVRNALMLNNPRVLFYFHKMANYYTVETPNRVDSVLNLIELDFND